MFGYLGYFPYIYSKLIFMKKSQLKQIIKEEIKNSLLRENKLLKENRLFSKYITTTHPDGYDIIMSFSIPNEEELGLDYGTLDEIMEVKDIDGVKVYYVYI